MLLSFKDYQELGGKVTDEKEFAQLESDAEDLFNARTNMFYVTHDIDQDSNIGRVKYFRKALELQINFTHDIGASTLYDIADQSIHSVSIDGTTVQAGKVASDETRKGIYSLAWQYLIQTGLLFRGVPIDS